MWYISLNSNPRLIQKGIYIMKPQCWVIDQQRSNHMHKASLVTVYALEWDGNISFIYKHTYTYMHTCTQE